MYCTYNSFSFNLFFLFVIIVSSHLLLLLKGIITRQQHTCKQCKICVWLFMPLNCLTEHCFFVASTPSHNEHESQKKTRQHMKQKVSSVSVASHLGTQRHITYATTYITMACDNGNYCTRYIDIHTHPAPRKCAHTHTHTDSRKADVITLKTNIQLIALY